MGMLGVHPKWQIRNDVMMTSSFHFLLVFEYLCFSCNSNFGHYSRRLFIWKFLKKIKSAISMMHITKSGWNSFFRQTDEKPLVLHLLFFCPFAIGFVHVFSDHLIFILHITGQLQTWYIHLPSWHIVPKSVTSWWRIQVSNYSRLHINSLNLWKSL